VNDPAFHKKRRTVDDSQQPHDLQAAALDCWQRPNHLRHRRADRATCHTPAMIHGVVGRCSAARHALRARSITRCGTTRRTSCGRLERRPEDIDAVGAYDAFTFTSMLQLEDYGFCKKGEGGEYVSSGITRLGGKRPQNTSGGHLCEGYTHGMNMVIENVRQLRHDADDYCPVGPDGKRQHTFDYREGGCRQVRNIEVTANLGWANPMTGSAMVMRRG
jgi:acetyl-CoA acetyltransferase